MLVEGTFTCWHPSLQANLYQIIINPLSSQQTGR
jgi:hypothetical protein